MSQVLDLPGVYDYDGLNNFVARSQNLSLQLAVTSGVAAGLSSVAGWSVAAPFTTLAWGGATAFAILGVSRSLSEQLV